MLAARRRKLITARARKNKRTARMLANARKDHSIPLMIFVIYTQNVEFSPTLLNFFGHQNYECPQLLI